ncbi:MAG TPA: cupin domain-containing protein [Mycobacteriales bacterium]|nr:cupin domain-containing protein [Mycobacteriales bacterium]
MRTSVRLIVAVSSAVALAVAGTELAGATPPAGGSVTTLTRGTVGPMHESSSDFKLFQKGVADFVTVSYQLAPGGTLGWHTHPGPALITVTQGTLTIVEGDCTEHTYPAGSAFVDVGMGEVHNAFNRGSDTVLGYATYLNVPVGGASRIDADPPACWNG